MATGDGNPKWAVARKYPRVEVKVHAKYKTTYTYVYTTAAVLNLSRGGLFIKTERPLEEGADVEVNLHFDKLEKSIAVKGVVRWKRGGSGGGPAGMGVEFLDADEKMLAQIESEVQKAPKNF